MLLESKWADEPAVDEQPKLGKRSSGSKQKFHESNASKTHEKKKSVSKMEPINFDKYRDVPINDKSSNQNRNRSRSRDKDRKFKGHDDKKTAYNTPPTSQGKSDSRNKTSASSQRSSSPSKIDLLKKKIEQQKEILKVTKHKEEQKRLLDDFLNGTNDFNWTDDDD